MTQSDFKNQVDNLMNILFGAGVASHATIIEQINYLVFLRSLSKKDDNAMKLDPSAEMIFSGELKRYHWNNLLILNADELFSTLEDIFRKLPELTTDQTIKLLFRDAHVKIFDKPTLRRLVHEIEKMFDDLEKLSTSGHTDIFGDMYEYLLGKLSQAGTLGSFRTPRHIVKFMVDIIDPKKGETILDPACGTAGFLVAALKHLEEKYTSEDYKKLDKYPMDLLSSPEREFVYRHTFTGYDSDFDMFKFGLMNLYLHKLEHPNIKRQNTLVDTAGDRTKWDVILANPPFSGALDIDSISEDLRMGTRSTEILFLRYMIDHLSASGRAGVIVPEGVVFNSTNAHRKIRQMLVEDAGLWCVVSLPSGIFNPYAGVKTSILFFDKSLKNKVKDILFVKVENDGFDLGATKRPIEKNDLPTALKAIEIYKTSIANGKTADIDLLLNSNSVASSKEGLKNLGYDLTAVEQVDLAKVITKVMQSEIKQKDYILTSDRYQKTKISTVRKWPLVKLGEVIKLNFGERITKNGNGGRKYPVYGGGGESFRTDRFNRENEYVISRFAMSENCVRYVIGQFWLMDSGGTFSVNNEFEDKLDKQYVGNILINLQKEVFGCSRGGAQKNLDSKYFYELEIPLPPLEIQKQIIEELDGYQRIIDGATKVTENWKPKVTVDPKWNMVKLGELGTLKNGLNFLKNENGNTLKIVGVKDFQDNLFVQIDNLENVTVNKIGKEFILEDGDILFVRSNGNPKLIGRCLVLDKSNGVKITFSGFSIRLRLTRNQIDPVYCALVLKQDEYRKILFESGNGANIKSLNQQSLSNIQIPVPSIEIQKNIVEQLKKERDVLVGLRWLINLYKNMIDDRILNLWEK